MGFDFFDIDEKEPPKPEKPKKKPTPKEECPFCGKEFSSLSRHIKVCPDNPDNTPKPVPKPEPKPKIAAAPSRNEDEIIKELREQFLKTITPEQKEDITLKAEEMDKIREVVKFLGGTEGYQFIYKSITGDKIRGSMPTIIDECIEWLKKHKLCLLWHKK